MKRFAAVIHQYHGPALKVALLGIVLLGIGCSATISRTLLSAVQANSALHTALNGDSAEDGVIEWVSILPGTIVKGAADAFQREAQIVAVGSFEGWTWRVRAVEAGVAGNFEAAFKELAASSDGAIFRQQKALEDWDAVFESLYATSAVVMAMEPPDLDLELLLVPEGTQASFRSSTPTSGRPTIELAIDITPADSADPVDLYIRDLMRMMAIAGSQVQNFIYLKEDLPLPSKEIDRRLKMEANAACWLTGVRRSFFLGYDMPVRPRPPESIDPGTNAVFKNALYSEYTKRPDDLHLAQTLGLLFLLDAQAESVRSGDLSFPQSGADVRQINSEVQFCRNYIAGRAEMNGS